MLQVSEEARKAIKGIMEEKGIESPLRVFLATGG
jgi:hypothetical protein